MKKIAFMGSDVIVLPLLDYLYENSGKEYQLVGIISQPDRPSGRGKKMLPNPVSAWAMEHGIRLFRPEKPSEEELEWLRQEGIDLVLVWAYGHIIKQEFLDTPPLGMLNCHASLLPKFRGAACPEAAIASGERVTGLTLMKMVKKMDAGDVLDKEVVEISSTETSASLREKLSYAGVPLISRNLPAILSGKAKFTPQDETEVSFTRKLSKEDAWLNFKASAIELERRVRAQTPWPGACFKFNETVIKIGACEALEGEGEVPGTVIGADALGLYVATGEGVLLLKSLQRPGRPMVPAADFLRGFPIEKGTVLESGVMPSLVSNTPSPFLYAKRAGDI